MEFVYPVGHFLQRIVLKAFADWRMEGKENVPPMGPLIVVANHQSNMDSPLLGVSVPRRLYFVAKEGVFKGPVSRAILHNYGAFPVRRDGTDSRALRWLLKKLGADKAVVLFPEGTRSPGRMKEALPGVAAIALRSQAPILPVGITGTERIGPLWKIAFPTGKIRVNIGQPFSLPVIEGKVQRDQLESLTQMIMQRIAALLPESYQGVYGIKKQASAPDTV